MDYNVSSDFNASNQISFYADFTNVWKKIHQTNGEWWVYEL